MSDGAAIFAAVVMTVVVILGLAGCIRNFEACKAAGGTPVYEYKNLPSCWDKDGRRIFP